MSFDLEKLRTIRQGGKTAGMVRLRELSGEGRVTGCEIDYADGRVEAVVRPATARAGVSISDPDRQVDVTVRPAPARAGVLSKALG